MTILKYIGVALIGFVGGLSVTPVGFYIMFWVKEKARARKLKKK
jgi:hypothetical protein